MRFPQLQSQRPGTERLIEKRRFQKSAAATNRLVNELLFGLRGRGWWTSEVGIVVKVDRISSDTGISGSLEFVFEAIA